MLRVKKLVVISLEIISSFVVLSIALPLVVMLLLHVGSVQQYVVHQFSNYASNYLGVKVSVESVYLKFFKRAVVNGFYVEDPDSPTDTLLFVDRVDAYFDRFDITNKKLYFSSADVDGGGLFLSTDADSIVNIKKVVDIMRPEIPSEQKFKMAITTIDVDSFELRFKKFNPPPPKTKGAINYFDFAFQNISANASNFELILDSIMMKVDSLSFTERSGLSLNALSCEELTVSPSLIKAVKGDISIDKSTFFVSEYTMEYQDWRMDNYIHDVVMNGHIAKSSINFSTIEKLGMLPARCNFVFNVIGGFSGTVDNFDVNLILAQYNNSIISSSNFSIKGLPDLQNCTFDSYFGFVQSNDADISQLSSQFAGKYIAPIPMLSKATPLVLSGSCTGRSDSIAFEGELNTFLGDVSLGATTQITNDSVNVNGSISSQHYNLGALLSNKNLGYLSFYSNINTTIFNGGVEKGELSLELPNVAINGYNYHGIDVNGVLQDSVANFSLNGGDPNLIFNADGYYDFSSPQSMYGLDLSLSKANLFALNINKRDSVSILSTNISLQGKGVSVDEINSSVVFSDVKYNTARDTLVTDSVEIYVENLEKGRKVEVLTEFASASLSANQPFEKLIPYVTYNINTFLPYLVKGSKEQDSLIMKSIAASSKIDSVENRSDYIFELKIDSENRLSSILLPGLTLANGTYATIEFSPTNNRFLVKASSKNIKFKNSFALEDLALNAYNSSDTLYYNYSGKTVTISDVFMPNLSLYGWSKGGQVDGKFEFNNSHDGSSAVVEVWADIAREESGELKVHTDILPSYLTMGGTTFNILPSAVSFNSGRVEIDNFLVESQGHKLKVDGVFSKNSNDTLKFNLDGVGLSRLSLFTQPLGYDVDGTVNGNAYYVSELGKNRIFADISVDSLRLNQHRLPKLEIKSVGVDTENNFTNYNILAGGKKIVDGFLDLNTMQYRANVSADSVKLAAIDPFMKSIGHGTDGLASLNVSLDNKRRPLNINGWVDIHEFATTIDFTKVEYNAKGRVEIEDNYYTLRDGVISDTTGTSAPLLATLDCGDYYKMVDYTFYSQPSQFLCLNTTIDDNPLFYGTVFATGELSVLGKGTDVNMNISANAVNNSNFFVPLSDKSTINDVDFITYIQPKVEKKEDEREFISFAKRSMLNKRSNFRLGLNAVVDSDTEVQLIMDPTVGDIIKTRGNGEFNIVVNPTQNIFEMEGAYNISTGGYLFTLPNFELVNKYFDIKTGSSIEWNGDPLGANLDIVATYRTKTSLAPLLGSSSQYNRRVDVDCDLTLTGMLLQPDIKLGISVPGADPETQGLMQSALNTEEAVSRQIFWLLFANSFYADATENGTTNVTVGMMGTAGAVTGLEFLSNQISNWISSDKFNLGINYRPRSELSSDEVELNISAPLLNNRLILEAEGNYDFHNNSSAYISENDNALSGNFYITYVIDQKGNLRLKAFTRQITTFDENQGLQESGVGIYYKEEFDDFKDLVSIRKKERDSRRKRRMERRKARE